MGCGCKNKNNGRTNRVTAIPNNAKLIETLGAANIIKKNVGGDDEDKGTTK